MKGHLNIPSPPIVPEGYTNSVPDYNMQVAKVLGAFIVFIAAYIFTFLLAIAICLGLGLAGLMLIASTKGIFLALLGGLFLVVAVLMLIFSLRFLVNIKSQDPDLRELRPEEAPELFELIKETATTVKAPVPKKVYVNLEMNASVWIPNGLLNPILKPHKYLTLGLPLVAGLNKSELKAILAHELAHFSQSTTWLTSYLSVATLSVQKVLYKDDGMEGAMETLYKLYIFRSANSITLFFTRMLHSILVKAYDLLNYTYQGLSRAMEYHADITSASVAGTHNTIHALRRNELATVNYDRLIAHIGNIHDQSKKQCKDLVFFHRNTLLSLSEGNRLAIEPTSQLPIITDDDNKRMLKSRIKYSDLWSSHPSTYEREAFLLSHPLPQDADTNHELALLFFTDPSKLAEELTADFFANARKAFKEHANPALPVINEDEIEIIENGPFSELLHIEFGKQVLAPHYGNYYFMRDLISFNVDEELKKHPEPTELFDLTKLFNAEVDLLAEKYRYANEAWQVLLAIANNQIKAGYFELDDVSYKVDQAANQAARLEEETKQLKSELGKHDIHIFLSLYFKIKERSPNAAERFKLIQTSLTLSDELLGACYSQYVNTQQVLMSIGPSTSDEDLAMANQWLNQAETETAELLQRIGKLKSEPCAEHIVSFKTIGDTILSKPLQRLSMSEFNHDNNIAYYQQLEEMYGKLLELYQECFKTLIGEMDNIIKSLASKDQTIGTTEPQ